MNIRPLVFVAVLLSSACESSPDKSAQETPVDAAPRPMADGWSFVDARAPADQAPPPAILHVEVALDRLGFSSGVIDGKATRFDSLALRGFQEANSLSQTGKLDEPTKAAIGKAMKDAPTRVVSIPAAFAQGPFQPDLPKSTAEQAKYEHLGYRNLMEALAERFHTTPELLRALNSPTTKMGAGAVIRVPNVAEANPAKLVEDERGWNKTLVTLGVSPAQPQAARIVVDKSEGALRAYDEQGRLLLLAPATMGSEHDPLPIGNWTIQGVSRNPDFHYNPELFWDVSDSKKSEILNPGPNGPVGVAWLDLSKPHYGIHGTAEPTSIGISESHGCVRLTNWDAARLAQMVKPGVKVVFQA